MSDEFFDEPSSVPAVVETSKAVALRGVSNEICVAQLLFDSGLFPSARNVGGVFTIVQYGKEVGLSPVVALNSVAIINGKLSMSGASMLALAMKHGVKATIITETNEICKILFERAGYEPYESTFTIEDAKQAELLKEDNGKIKHEGWRKYPNQMLRWRAVSKGLKVVAPDILAGVYTDEELQSIEKDTPELVEPGPPTQPGCAQNDTPVDMTEAPEKQEEKPRVASDVVTEGQLKMLHALMNERGIGKFRDEFKRFLVGFEGNGMDPDAPSAKSMKKKFASDLIGKFKGYATQFVASPKHQEAIKNAMATMDGDSLYASLIGIKSLLNDAEWFKIDEKERDVARLTALAGLVIAGLTTQEHNRLADAANDKKLSVDEAVGVMQELGMDPKVVTGATLKENKPKPKQDEWENF